ncbi:amino acid ABC transporter ATP-binding protein [Nocardia sp. alder85J]|nr:amino acid ABC transporter ATP-binding protein [Nocardia sp. alder85J]
MVELDRVTKRYGPVTVLDEVSLTLAEHTTTCLIGASGSGKSTLLRCVNGLETIDGGSIRFAGERISGFGVDLDEVRRHVGIVFQSYNLFPHMTVLENVMLAPCTVLRLARGAARERAERLLHRVGLADRAGHYPDRLSGGQQQRVAIARALALEPRVILLDEITSALDPELVGEVLALIGELAAEGMTMVLATHEMAFAREVADTVCFLDGGRIHEQGPPEQLFGAPRQERTRTFLSRVRAGGPAAPAP